MLICGEKVTHMVRAEGKTKIGFVCDKHLIRTEEIVKELHVELNVVRYEGEPRYCQLPASVEVKRV